ncbi:nuclease-related domain-containing protein [Rubrobacter indicoceani]|uniref:nuclease-related domain-containing protein n=1 Tax=Rubrobacter indicoceani TaxID=2051957 RepID=UPI000E5A4B2B|nr:nuclease-related domain-containing protein [Rubrobacter indicoceani]
MESTKGLKRSRAGGYVRDQFIGRTRVWLYLSFLIFLVYVPLAFGVLLSGDASWSVVALIIFSLLGVMYMVQHKIEAADATWGKGARAERAVGDELDKLYKEGFHVFHDYKPDNFANVDHFIVGPTGVFAIETKSSEGEITSDGMELMLNGRRLSHKNPLKQVRGEAKQIHNLIKDTCGMSRWVHPILCYSEAEVRFHGRACGVEVINPGSLGRLIMTYRGGGEKLSVSEIRAISVLLQRRIGVSPAAAPGSPPETPGKIRSIFRPERVLVVLTVMYVFIVSVAFAGNTASAFEAFAELYRAVEMLKEFVIVSIR